VAEIQLERMLDDVDGGIIDHDEDLWSELPDLHGPRSSSARETPSHLHLVLIRGGAKVGRNFRPSIAYRSLSRIEA